MNKKQDNGVVSIEVTNETFRTKSLTEIAGGEQGDWYEFESLSGVRRFKSKAGIKRAITNVMNNMGMHEGAVVVYGPIKDCWEAAIRYYQVAEV